MPSPTKSPTKVSDLSTGFKPMSFAEALKQLLKGKKVRRLEWENHGVYLVLSDEFLMIYQTKDKQLHPLTISKGDMVNNDWVVC